MSECPSNPSSIVPADSSTNEELSDQSDLPVPVYIDYCKFLLVEDLALEEDYRRMHYGRCTVIGRLQYFCDCGRYCLENIRLPLLPREYQLTEGACTIQLEFNTNSCNHLRQVNPGDYCEILGEVVLLSNEENKKKCPEKSNPRFLIDNLNAVVGVDVAEITEKRNALLSFFQANYKPVIRVWFINRVNRAADLITRNLKLRYLNEKTDH